jgi:hypothetical protein
MGGVEASGRVLLCSKDQLIHPIIIIKQDYNGEVDLRELSEAARQVRGAPASPNSPPLINPHPSTHPSTHPTHPQNINPSLIKVAPDIPESDLRAMFRALDVDGTGSVDAQVGITLATLFTGNFWSP